jgi:hypothetical protein
LRDVVVDHARARDRPPHGVSMADISLEKLHACGSIFVVDQIEDPHPIAARAELLDDGFTEVSRTAGYEREVIGHANLEREATLDESGSGRTARRRTGRKTGF